MFAEQCRQGMGRGTLGRLPFAVRVAVFYVVAWVGWFALGTLTDTATPAARLACWLAAVFVAIDVAIVAVRVYRRRRATH